MKFFSERALESLNGFYVYALIDPRNNKVFYIGKGKGNRIFEHEDELNVKEKNHVIQSIKKDGYEVKKVIVSWNMTEDEAFKVEASLINLFNYCSNDCLTNIVSGHHIHEALEVSEFEMRYAAVPLKENDIKHNILVIKINKLYNRKMTEKDLYEATRGFWRISMNEVKNVDYVFAVYNQLVVAVYKPDEWHFVRERIDIPRSNEYKESLNNRLYFISYNYEDKDENQKFYLHKSIVNFKINAKSQNPISYIFKYSQKESNSDLDQQENIYDEPTFEYVIVKTKNDTVKERGSLYEAARRQWKVGKQIEKYKYVLCVIDKVVKKIYVVDKWNVIQEGPYKGRYEFFGYEAKGEEFNILIDKTIPYKYRKRGLASAVLYKK